MLFLWKRDLSLFFPLLFLNFSMTFMQSRFACLHHRKKTTAFAFRFRLSLFGYHEKNPLQGCKQVCLSVCLSVCQGIVHNLSPPCQVISCKLFLLRRYYTTLFVSCQAFFLKIYNFFCARFPTVPRVENRVKVFSLFQEKPSQNGKFVL